MTAQDQNDEILAPFKNAAKRQFGLPDDAGKGLLVACQVYQALLSVTNWPREELSDGTLVHAIASGVSDALCRVTKQEDLKDATEEFIDAFRYDNHNKIDNGFCSETFLPELSLADEKSLSACIAETLEKRIRIDEWRARIYNGDERLSFEEFERRAQREPKPTGPLEPDWQIKRHCKGIIWRLQAGHPLVAAAEKLLAEIENQRAGEDMR